MHFYNANGESCHRVPAKSSGQPRPTTIADARRMGLIPSVTTVLDILRKKQLESWQQDQVALAARRLIGHRDLPTEDKAFCEAIKNEAFRQVDAAADLGTRLHEAIVLMLANQPYADDLKPYLAALPMKLAEWGLTIEEHELRLISLSEGYAGTTDAVFFDFAGRRGILDFKTRKSSPLQKTMIPWDGQATQIAAYHLAKFGAIVSGQYGANIFISTTEPGRIEMASYDADELREEWEFFRHLLFCWRIRHDYDPRKASSDPEPQAQLRGVSA